MLKKVLFISLWFLLVSGLIISLGFVNVEHEKVTCKKVNININYDDENFFIDREEVLELIKEKGDSLFNQPIGSIDIPSIEMILNNHPVISNAEVFQYLDGEISIDIKQRKPILRIINNTNESYYLDADGKLMPLSSKFSSRVLIANGNIAETYAGKYLQDFSTKAINDSLLKNNMLYDLYRLAKYVNEDEFWKAQIVQIYIGEELELVPRFGNHKIIFGDCDDLEDKFKKLFIFYKEGLNKVGWNSYSTINLKYKNQVVCTKAS